MTLFAVGPVCCMIPIVLLLGVVFYILTEYLREPDEPPPVPPAPPPAPDEPPANWPAHWPR